MFVANDAAIRAIELSNADTNFVLRIPIDSTIYGVKQLPTSYVQLQTIIICAIKESSSLN